MTFLALKVTSSVLWEKIEKSQKTLKDSLGSQRIISVGFAPSE